MNRFTIPIILATCALVLSGCATWQAQQGRNRDNLMKLEIGISKAQVIEVMGPPDLNEAYQKPGGGTLVALFYYTNRIWADGNVTRDECTPVVLQDGKVIGWGQDFLQATLNIDVRIKNE